MLCGIYSLFKGAGSRRTPLRWSSLFSNAMRIFETERLVARQLTLDDGDFIQTLLNDASFLKYIGDRKVRNHADERKYLLVQRFTRVAGVPPLGLGSVQGPAMQLLPDSLVLGGCISPPAMDEWRGQGFSRRFIAYFMRYIEKSPPNLCICDQIVLTSSLKSHT